MKEVLSRTELNDIVKSIWCKCESGVFATEVSTLDANLTDRGYSRGICPSCFNEFKKQNMNRIIWHGSGEDREVGGWEFTCPHCKSKLEIFND